MRSISGRRSRADRALARAPPSRPWRSCRRSGTRSAPRRRRGRGTARRPRRRPRRSGRPARSTLLTTRITGSRASSALRSTKRVCGSGPSLASTSSSTPSTIVSPRSTSPPKSACPGVSMMLILTPPWWTAVFLARIVMPFSRSRSSESMTRVATSWFGAERARTARASRRPAWSCRGRRGRRSRRCECRYERSASLDEPNRRAYSAGFRGTARPRQWTPIAPTSGSGSSVLPRARRRSSAVRARHAPTSSAA